MHEHAKMKGLKIKPIDFESVSNRKTANKNYKRQNNIVKKEKTVLIAYRKETLSDLLELTERFFEKD